MKTIVYVGNFAFPNKNASGKRVLGNCLCFQKLGFRTVCIGPGQENHEVIFNTDSYTIEIGNSIQRVIRHNIDKVIDIIRCESKRSIICAVVIYGAIYTQSENRLIIEWCHKHSIKVLYDQVDWLELNWHNPFRAIIRAFNHSQMNSAIIPKCDGVICISQYLEDYHKKQGLKTVVIPPLSSLTVIADRKADSDELRPIKIVYAGTSSDVHRPVRQWKDRLDLVFSYFAELQKNEKLRDFIIDIYGLSLQQYINMFPKKDQAKGIMVIKQLQNKVIFHGRVDNSTAVKGIQNADFTILLRDVKRSTMAGFPTKVSESISYGTPVICNDTSDIKKYLIDREMGIVVSMDEIKGAIEEILQMSNDEIMKRKIACADNPFQYNRFTEKFAKLFDEIGIRK